MSHLMSVESKVYKISTDLRLRAHNQQNFSGGEAGDTSAARDFSPFTNAGKASTDAISYFGYVQNLYNLFSAAPQRWEVLKQWVNITLKSWSETKWESRIKSVEPIRAKPQMPLPGRTPRCWQRRSGPTVSKFVQWSDVLHQVNTVSKLLQSPKMQLDVAVDLLMKAKASLLNYRTQGFAAVQTTASFHCL
ncbi:hypothetical protein N1851_006703 [Merluccius polli]|uniref:Uncharacterized protein n=1 Tax=Merluccius polli TaxID=89951 RepID=A0AA47N476_MERPO|nr:hypothetical protein N1851_006703 [Merluccius polli]